MHRVLITGMSATGKSTVINRLSELDQAGRIECRAVDLDGPQWSEWVTSPDGSGPSPLHPGQDWVWREDRVDELLSTHSGGVLVVSGCASNQGRFHRYFDEIVLLSAPVQVMAHRLVHRDGNSYGKHPVELARSLEFTRTVEPLLRRAASVEIDTGQPLDEVMAQLLVVVGCG